MPKYCIVYWEFQTSSLIEALKEADDKFCETSIFHFYGCQW